MVSEHAVSVSRLRQLIGAVLQDKPSSTDSVFNGLSKNYVLSSPLGSVQSNVIFESGNTLPKEMKLEASLKAYDRSFDMFQVGDSRSVLHDEKTRKEKDGSPGSVLPGWA